MKEAFPEKAVATVEEARVSLYDMLCFQAPVLASWQHKCTTVFSRASAVKYHSRVLRS